MRTRPIARFVVLTALCLVVAGACASGAPSSTGPSAAPETVDLTVLGAASLKGVLERATAAYETARPGVTVTVATDSSTALATQIEQGAPADVFLSADATNPQALIDEGLVDGAAVTFARNELVIIVPADDPAGIATPADLAKPGVKIIAAGDKVPITEYASQLVQNLAKEPGASADFAAAYAANIVSREDNVKNVVAKITTGDGDAGIVYVTDATAADDDVRIVEIPDAANVRATYDGVVIKASRDRAAAKAFLDWLAGSDGQAILVAAGFLPPS